MPANPGRADETQKGDPRICRERLGELVGFGKENLTPARRQPGLMEQAYKIEAGGGHDKIGATAYANLDKKGT
jgi:hypothetical protein